ASFGQKEASHDQNAIVRRYDIHQISLLKLNRFFRAINRFKATKNKHWNGMTEKYLEERKKANDSLEVDLYYVHEFEQGIKTSSESFTVTVPYWNYTTYHSDPLLDPVFLNYMFGKEVAPDKCLTD
ncbi:hypothetical protein L0F63_004818, partial [Massospora cicadina]